MALSISGIWTKMTLSESCHTKDDSGAIYGEMSTQAPVMLNEMSPQKVNHSSFHESISMRFLTLEPPQLILWILVEICCEMTVVFFMPYMFSQTAWLLPKYKDHIKELLICFCKVQVKNNVMDNKFVTVFEGKRRHIIELRGHSNLCFGVISTKDKEENLHTLMILSITFMRRWHMRSIMQRLIRKWRVS